MEQIKTLIENRDYTGIRKALETDPSLANEGITIPFDKKSTIRAHPLHRICDPVMAGKMTDVEALAFAKIFLEFGAHINGADVKINEDTPLLAASSLHAEKLAIFYIEQGADLNFRGRHDGATALHWASFCGLDELVNRLILEKAILDEPDTAYNCTPLGWAIEALMSTESTRHGNQLRCMKFLLKAGADVNKLNGPAGEYLRGVATNDSELSALF